MNLCLIDSHGKLVYCSGPAERLLGLGCGRSLSESDRGAELKIALEDSRPRVRFGGSEFTVETAPIDPAGGDALRAVVLGEVGGGELPMSAEALPESTKRVFSRIYHELANIITPVSLYVTMAQQRCGPGRTKEMLSDAGSQLERIQVLLQRFREYYRDPELSRETVELGSLVDSALSDLSASAAANWVRPEITGVDRKIDGDLQKLKQVLLDIFTNSWEAMEEEPEKKWSIEGDEKAGATSIIVRDNGCGIDSQFDRDVFHPFFTTKAARQRGLGLSIALRIIQAHGGTIDVSSRQGAGTTVTIGLPRSVDCSAAH